MLAIYICFITGQKMTTEEKLEELDRLIAYIKSVLKEKQDERFCLIAEKKGHKAPNSHH